MKRPSRSRAFVYTIMGKYDALFRKEKGVQDEQARIRSHLLTNDSD